MRSCGIRCGMFSVAAFDGYGQFESKWEGEVGKEKLRVDWGERKWKEGENTKKVHRLSCIHALAPTTSETRPDRHSSELAPQRLKTSTMYNYSMTDQDSISKQRQIQKKKIIYQVNISIHNHLNPLSTPNINSLPSNMPTPSRALSSLLHLSRLCGWVNYF